MGAFKIPLRMEIPSVAIMMEPNLWAGGARQPLGVCVSNLRELQPKATAARPGVLRQPAVMPQDSTGKQVGS